MKWISVKDKLPEYSGEFINIKCSKMAIISNGDYVTTSFYEDGSWVDAFDGLPLEKTPTHWMPLPEPPKQD